MALIMLLPLLGPLALLLSCTGEGKVFSGKKGLEKEKNIQAIKICHYA